MNPCLLSQHKGENIYEITEIEVCNIFGHVTDPFFKWRMKKQQVNSNQSQK